MTGAPALITAQDDDPIVTAPPLVARDVLRPARTILYDPAGTVWPLGIMIEGLNAALRDMASLAPTSLSRTIRHTLAPGARQTLPAEYTSLLRIARNLVSMPVGTESPDRRTPRGGNVVMVEREFLDAVEPDWANPAVTSPTAAVEHGVYDPALPREFWVYPPNRGGGDVELVVLPVLADIARIGNDENIDAQTQPLHIQPIYRNALRDGVLAFCYATTSDIPLNAARAEASRAAFERAIGVPTAARTAVNPDTVHRVSDGEANR